MPADWDATADLKPYQYNLVSKQRVKKAYKIDVVPVHAGSVRQHDWTAFFSRVNVKWCEQFGWPNRSTKKPLRYAARCPMSDGNRRLTEHERRLVRWMLEHGSSEAAAFLPQLELAEVPPWRCPCGCASIQFQIRGKPAAPPGVHPIADFMFGEEETLCGIFVYEKDGILSGLEVYGLAGDAPKSLPEPEALRPVPGSPAA
ncbi:MAG TPA: hypothetical protein VGY58_13980 [Gemmataceae bacterium]|nr:hypothetical protein [Gemmataceae bacterium]